MKIKRYVAPTMREAIAQVREEQGPEAVILSNRRIEEGMEVIAAIDYDESLMSQAIAQLTPRAQRAAAMAPRPDDNDTDAAIAHARAQMEKGTVPFSRKWDGADAGGAQSGNAQNAAVRSAHAHSNTAASEGVRDGDERRAPPTARTTPVSARATNADSRPAAAAAPAVAARKKSSAVAAVEAAAGIDGPSRVSARALLTRATTATTTTATTTPGTSTSTTEVSRAEKRGLSPFPEAETQIASVRDEVQGLRSLLESQLASLAWNDMGRRQPLKAKVLRDLAALDIAPEIAREIVDEMPAIENLRDSWKVPLGLLLKRIPVTDDGILEHGGVVAVVGPTGVGKTTTIAKIAARFALKHGAHHVALVSTDTYRIGAREQLLTYARILGVSMHVAQDATELANALTQLEMKKLVLIDTAGMSQRDLRLNEQFATLHNDHARIRVLLALSAAAEYSALEETVRVFERIRPSACVLTKLDEAASLGAPLSIAIRHGLAIAHLCDGQRVPEDLHPAYSRRAWLMQTAMKMRRDSQRVADESMLAEHFGRMAVHA